MLDQIIETALGQDLFEWIGLLSGIIYVLLAARENPHCWWFGILSCSMIAYKDVSDYRLLADAGLQVFYIIMGIWGLWLWFRKKDGEPPLQITSWKAVRHLIVILVGLAATLPIGYLLNTYTDAAFSYIDTFTTVFSIIATIMLVHKVLDNWIYWIVLNLIYVYIYADRSGFLFAFLLFLYAIIAVYGYFNWRHKKGLIDSEIKAADI